jgi:hypothetical protein
MSEAVQVALIVTIPVYITTVYGIIVGLRNSRQIKEVHDATNGMKAELVRVTGEAEHAKGVKEERDRRDVEKG